VSHVILLVIRDLVEGAKDFVENLESTLSPDDETTNVTTRGKLKEVEPLDIDKFDSWDVSESFHNTLVLIIYNEGTTTLTMPTIPEFSLPSTEFTGIGDFDNISMSFQRLQEGDCLLSLSERLSSTGNHQGNFLDLLDAMATGKNKARKS